MSIVRHAYTLNNNSTTKFANWVAYHITKDTPASGKTRNWKTDPALNPADTTAPADYTGANAALKVDRGHQAPLASLAGVSDWESLNYLSNITPQKSDLNPGRTGTAGRSGAQAYRSRRYLLGLYRDRATV